MAAIGGKVLWLGSALLSVWLAGCSGSSPDTPAPVRKDDGDATLQNTYWKLTQVEGRPVRIAGSLREPHLRLLPGDAQATGNGGCNGFSGSYQLSGDSLRITEITSTLMACMDPELNQQERTFFDALRATRGWRITGDTLELSGQSGPLARFTAQRPG